MKVADALSRASLVHNSPEIPDSDVQYFVHSIITSLPTGT